VVHPLAAIPSPSRSVWHVGPLPIRAYALCIIAGVIVAVFYLLYQQVENFLIYPRVMSRSVEIPGALTVIAALVGGTLLGVVGALLAIPTAAAILLLVKEVLLPRQEAR